MKKISFPIIALNFKTYAQAFGENSLRLAKIAEEVSEQFGVTIAVAPPMIDLARVAAEVEIPVFAQHVDPYKPGSHTGSIIAEDVKAAGAVGSLVNHSEHRLRLADIGMVLERLRENELISLLCTDTVETAKAAIAIWDQAKEEMEILNYLHTEKNIDGNLSNYLRFAGRSKSAEMRLYIKAWAMGVPLLCGDDDYNYEDFTNNSALVLRGESYDVNISVL